MGLKTYNKKRDFSKTPEPKGSIKPNSEQLHFVVQKHNATRLHYDFRLEIDGVLKSWAVPKGPSLNPKDKRLAMQVEDHPFDYRHFEGIIPEDNYGAGEVIVWDEGTYSAPEMDKEKGEEFLRKGFEAGNFRFFLNGEKLKGEFTLRKMNTKDNKAWLLIKKKDEFASEEDITLKDKSLKSGKRVEELKINDKKVHEALASTSDKGENKENFSDAEHEISSGKKTLRLTNLKKVFWPNEGFTKGDLVKYYQEVSEYILPYLKNRPHTLLRHPKGIYNESFFQKDVGKMAPDWIKTELIELESAKRSVRYLICTNKTSLLYMVNLGCIEINPWFSRISNLANPDYLVIDLDPLDVAIDKVIHTALAVKEVLDEAKAKSFCKTSGSTGLHIYVPLKAKYSFEISKNFAHLIVQLVHEKLPDITSLQRSPAKRIGKVYLDYMQNAIGQTVAAPYSVRPKPGATVSTPLKWEEVSPGLDPGEFTIVTIQKRLKNMKDIFTGILGAGIDIEKCISNLEAVEKIK